MRAPLRIAAFVAAGLMPLLSVGVSARPAAAHGAPTSPVSRAFGCGPQGQFASTAACKAAIAASGGAKLDWDNVRVANVNGRDRERIPDGELCSGGVDQFKGLDAGRTDWPTTTLTAGATYSFAYRTTIAHEGTFRMYVTKSGYTAGRVLRWADLEAAPFLTAKDPAVRSGSYVMSGRLPSGLTGRHLIYTIWQNSSTADTYYSCSDVVFGAAGGAPGAAAPSQGSGVAGTPAGGPPETRSPNGEPGSAAGSAEPVTRPLAASGRTRAIVPIAAASGAAVLLASCAALLVLRRRATRPSARGRHAGP